MARFNLDLSRLAQDMKTASLTLRKPRQERTDMVRQLVGLHYSENGSSQAVPVNLMALYCQIIGPALISNNPRVMLSTFDTQAKPTVLAMQGWINKQIEQLRLANVFRRVILDALFAVGVCKVAIATPQDAATVAWKLRAGMPFAERVDLDDFLFDVHARDFEEVGWIGHRIRVPLASVREDKSLSKRRKELTAQPDPLYNPEGDERIGVIGRGYYSEQEEYEEMVDLWEVYLPRHRAVFLLACDQGGSISVNEDPLKETSWIGPDEGPYHIFGMDTVPGNVMPLGPLQNLFDLHLAHNNFYRKLIRQSQRLKALTGYQAGNAEDAERIRMADDGDLVPLVNPAGVVPFVTGGPNQTLLAMADHSKGIFDFVGGGLALQGGLGPQSKTLGQDELLQENASRVTNDRQQKTTGYVAQVLKAMCWYWHHHPTLQAVHHEQIPGLAGHTIRRTATPFDRQQIPWGSLDFRVDPYSLVHQTPQQRAQQMNQVVTQIVIPMMQLLVQQGVQFDVNTYLKKLGAYLDMPDLAEILTISEPPQGMMPGQGNAGPAPANTTRTYQRVSRSGQSQQGREQDRISQLMNSPGANGNGQMRSAG